MRLQRYLNLRDLLAKKSFFLLGPRATGKTSLIKEQLSEIATIIDLLRTDISKYKEELNSNVVQQNVP